MLSFNDAAKALMLAHLKPSFGIFTKSFSSHKWNHAQNWTFVFGTWRWFKFALRYVIWQICSQNLQSVSKVTFMTKFQNSTVLLCIADFTLKCLVTSQTFPLKCIPYIYDSKPITNSCKLCSHLPAKTCSGKFAWNLMIGSFANIPSKFSHEISEVSHKSREIWKSTISTAAVFAYNSTDAES